MPKLLPIGKLTGNCFRFSFVASFLVATVTIASAAVTTNFFASFESPTYTASTSLYGQNEWTGYAEDTNGIETGNFNNGNGVITPGLGGSGQAPYVGLTPLGYLDLWNDFSFDPVASGMPIVNFSAKMKLNDSSNGNYDGFQFIFYNTGGYQLFGIMVNNHTVPNPPEVYGLDSTNGASQDGVYISLGVEYLLSVSMNFASNTYSASITNLSTGHGTTFLNSLPITINGEPLTLASVDVVWTPYNPATPGDNQLVFDDYLVTSQSQTLPPPPSPTLGVLTYAPGNGATVRLTGQNGYNYALDYSTNLATAWIPLATNVISGAYVDFPDPGASSAKSRFYRGRWVP
jgi:hypothetical protein